ncbi:VOC family protein [Sphingobium sp.]|uniref:VOC family protein n=1 Tax=Sphingobium sp. TaxID=1912891 RepID=UPI002B97BE79|nr:VOC family protein [Sphingobium sp.]HUD90430.1 VOC family protein [Sphingobium sp.]
MTNVIAGRPIRQIAYFVPDVEKAAVAHMEAFGSGPYYIAEHIPLSLCRYRGEPAELDHSSAYGQWGDIMVEFVQQNNPGRSCFHDIFPEGSGRQGMHHVALIVDDIKSEMTRFEEDGHEAALYAEVAPGVGFAMMDCVATLGHFVELYEPTPQLLGVYDLVRSAAQDFDGTDPIRRFAIG